MSASLNLSCALSRPAIPVTGQPQLLYLLLEATGGEGADSLPTHLDLVIDCSDSMRVRLVTDEQFKQLAQYGYAQEVLTDGVPAYQITSVPPEALRQFPRRIDYVAEALVIASEYLSAADCFSLIAFAGQALVMVPSSRGKDRARLQQAARELEYLNLGDSTQMDEGLALALEEHQRNPKSGCAGRLVLLTDGHTRNVSECYTWAKQARQAGLTLSTMGIGSEFNEDLLIPLADLTGGNAYYIETPDQIPAAFRKELGAALHVSYRNVDIKLQLPAGVTLRDVHRVTPELGNFDPGPNQGGSYALLLGNYDPSLPQSLLLEVVVPGWMAGNYRLCQAVLTWEDPDGGLSRPNQRQDVVIQVVEGAAGNYNQRVMNVVEKVGAYKLGTQALDAARQGDKGLATQRLRQAATRLLDLGEQSLADAMQRQADSLENSGTVDSTATKRLRYDTRRIAQSPVTDKPSD